MISLAMLHNPERPERRLAAREMLEELHRNRDEVVVSNIFSDLKPSGMPWSSFKTPLFFQEWDWAAASGATHHLFLTDDLHLAPGFWPIVRAMIAVAPTECIGLLSNHPEGPSLALTGRRWYRCNSWIVGPGYILPHEALLGFLAWRRTLAPGDGPGCADWYNDDDSINEWITRSGLSSLHPIPTCIEHRHDLESTVGHGDKFSRERVSWREMRDTIDPNQDGRFTWRTTGTWGASMPERMQTVEFWHEDGGPSAAPMLRVGG